MPNDTAENDLILIYFEGDPLAFARIESIDPDIKRGWYHVRLLLLQVPVQVVTWILRDAYINGEPFTMNGKQMRLERVSCPDQEDDADMQEDAPPAINQPAGRPDLKTGKVISLADLKKKPGRPEKS